MTPLEAHYIGIDPGKATGVATYKRNTYGESGLSLETLTKEEVYELLHEDIYPETIVFIEKFEIRSDTFKKTRQYDAMHIIGATSFVCHHNGASCEINTPGKAKGGFPDEAICEISETLCVAPQDDHQRDALRHLLLALSTVSPTGDWVSFYRSLTEGTLIR